MSKEEARVKGGGVNYLVSVRMYSAHRNSQSQDIFRPI